MNSHNGDYSQVAKTQSDVITSFLRERPVLNRRVGNWHVTRAVFSFLNENKLLVNRLAE